MVEQEQEHEQEDVDVVDVLLLLLLMLLMLLMLLVCANKAIGYCISELGEFECRQTNQSICREARRHLAVHLSPSPSCLDKPLAEVDEPSPAPAPPQHGDNRAENPEEHLLLAVALREHQDRRVSKGGDLRSRVALLSLRWPATIGGRRSKRGEEEESQARRERREKACWRGPASGDGWRSRESDRRVEASREGSPPREAEEHNRLAARLAATIAFSRRLGMVHTMLSLPSPPSSGL